MTCPNNMLEEELKNRVSHDYFPDFDTSRILGKIDFCVSRKVTAKDQESLEGFCPIQNLVWAESKKGNKQDIYASFVQLVLTIGQSRAYEKNLPPPFLAAFDAEKIAFIPYKAFAEVFKKNDFNWNVTPSNHNTKEFKELYKIAKDTMEEELLLYKFAVPEDEELLRQFIEQNLTTASEDNKAEITKNNFTSVYFLWEKKVKPTIDVKWEYLRKDGIIDADFYLADLLSKDNITLKDKLQVVLETEKYKYGRKFEISGGFAEVTVRFKDKGKAHHDFWKNFKRPPKEEYWAYIVERRDLLVPQDLRERKGSFFTPQQWVRLSQKYLANTLGENWQDEYVIWDCAAGTGNLLNGLTEKHSIFASTLDQADVDVMKDRIAHGANLLGSQVFQFDFLNDSFSDPKVPKELQKILKDPKRRSKLLIYINPPYAESSNVRQLGNNGENKAGVATETMIYKCYQEKVGTAMRELYAQFLLRIQQEIPGCVIGTFSTLKAVQATNFAKFRKVFLARLKSLFLVPADTFDNVKGQFPIGFFIWDCAEQPKTEDHYKADVYDRMGKPQGIKNVYNFDERQLVIDWIKQFYDKEGEVIGYLRMAGTSIQDQNRVFVTNALSPNDVKKKLFNLITPKNVLEMCIYDALRHTVDPTWLNDRDQYLFPLPTWKDDIEFQTNCLVFTLFNNNIKSEAELGNAWIPYAGKEIDAKGLISNDFMAKFLSGKIQRTDGIGGLFDDEKEVSLKFSSAAKEVLEAGKKLYTYYHTFNSAEPNASYYDIKAFFCGFNKGRLKTDSEDEKYMELNGALKQKLKLLGNEIEEKIYEHGFLLK